MDYILFLKNHFSKSSFMIFLLVFSEVQEVNFDKICATLNLIVHHAIASAPGIQSEKESFIKMKFLRSVCS